MSLWQTLEHLPAAAEWAGVTSIIRVISYRHLRNGKYLMIKKPQTRYYISSLNETVAQFARRIRESRDSSRSIVRLLTLDRASEVIFPSLRVSIFSTNLCPSSTCAS